MSVSFCDYDGHYHGGCSKPETFLVKFRVLLGSWAKKKISLSNLLSEISLQVKKKEEKKPSKRGGFFFPIKHEHTREIYIYKYINANVTNQHA